MLGRAIESFGPLLDRTGYGVHPIKTRLEVTIRSKRIAVFHRKEDVPTVIGPAYVLLLALVVGDPARCQRSLGRACRRSEVNDVNLEIGIFFLALIDG